MNVKRLLRFYFSADSLNAALDNLIMAKACSSPGRGGLDCAEALCEIIGEKQELSRLWAYLDGIICGMPEADRQALARYAALRRGLKSLDGGLKREIRRAAVKFARRARRADGFAEAQRLVGRYYCLIAPR